MNVKTNFDPTIPDRPWFLRVKDNLHIVGASDCAGEPLLAYRTEDDAKAGSAAHLECYGIDADPVQHFVNAVDAMHPSASLVCKLGSIAVHAEEFLSVGGHEFDKAALSALLQDSGVKAWLDSLGRMGLVPVKRSYP
jgi:hypothetical protein